MRRIARNRTHHSKSRRYSRAARFLGRPWWQGIGAIAGVVAIVITVIVLVWPKGKTQSIAKITLRDAGYAEYFFAGRADQLPRPPDYPAAEKAGHCERWRGWLESQPRIYNIAAGASMELLTGDQDFIAVRKVETRVFRRSPPSREHAIIQCKYGAGGDVGYEINVDTVTNKVLWTDLDTEKTSQMPPAYLSIKGQEYETATIGLVSRKGYLYEGMIVVYANINGKERILHYGSPGQPYRWIGGKGFDNPDMPSGRPYDWSPARQKWVDVNFHE